MNDVKKKAEFMAALNSGAAIIAAVSQLSPDSGIVEILEAHQAPFICLDDLHDVVELVREISTRRRLFVTYVAHAGELRDIAESLDQHESIVYVIMIGDQRGDSVTLADLFRNNRQN